MLDMVEAIAKAFPEASHYYWDSIGFDGLPAKGRKDGFGQWAWNSLPYYDVSWLRVPEDIEKRHRPLTGRWMMAIRHEADNGWEDGEGRTEPDARLFNRAEDSSSSLYITLWKAEVEKEKTWYEAWDNYPGWPDEETDSNEIDDDSGLRSVTIKRDMSDLISVEDVSVMAKEARRRGREDLGLDLPDLDDHPT